MFKIDKPHNQNTDNLQKDEKKILQILIQFTGQKIARYHNISCNPIMSQSDINNHN